MEAATVLERLRGLGHEYGPSKQTYKAELGETKVSVFNRRGMGTSVHARDLEHHVDQGGMYLTVEEAYCANPKTEEAAEFWKTRPGQDLAKARGIPIDAAIVENEAVPTASNTKTEILDWLERHGVRTPDDATKADLLGAVEAQATIEPEAI